MENPYTDKDFVHEVWEEFPQLAEWHNLDNDILPIWKLEQFIDAGYHNFDADRKPLYHLSRMIENYAQEHKEPLLATFEKIAKFSYVKERYQEMVKGMPKVWIIADFDDEVETEHPEFLHIDPCHITTETNTTPKPGVQYRRVEVPTDTILKERTRSLDYWQREVVNVGIRYAKDIVKGRRNANSLPTPPIYMVHGGAGAGKSAVIEVLAPWMQKIL